MLKGAFGKLISGGSSGAEQTFNTETPHGRLMAFFNEIEHTTVPRRLVLSIGSAEMTFDMGNKKVYRLIEVKPDSDGRGAIAARIERDYDQLDAQLKLLAEVLTAFVARPGKFDMLSRPSPINYPPKTDGFPASEWRFACDLYGVVPAAVVPEMPRSPAPAGESAPEVAAPSAAPAAPQAQPVMREKEMATATAAPAGATAPAAQQMAAGVPAQADTISSVINALGSAAPDVVAPAAAPAPVADDSETVQRFYETVAKYCDLAMLITEDGDVLQFTDEAAGWFDLGPDIARDMKSWVADTARMMPGCQLMMMRSPILQNQSVIFMTNGKMTAFGAFSSHVTGRLFAVANDFVRRKA